MLRLENGLIRNGGFELRAGFELAPAQRVAVIGASGSGKSSLLGGLSGVLPLAEGRLSWGGQEITALAPADRPVGILFQDGNLFPHLSINGTLAFALDRRAKVDAAGQARIDAVLDRVGLSGMGARKPAALSGGQMARAALARVLLQDAPVLLLDEPFGALGPALKAEMLGLVRELTEETGALLLMVSHDPEDARAICETVLWADDGAIHGPTETKALFDAPPAALAAYLG